MRRSKIAIVGGTGFLGTHLSEFLLSRGHDVMIVARSLRRCGSLALHPAVRFEAADITNRPEITAKMHSFCPDVVYHLACESDAPESVDHVLACLQSNALGTVNVLQASISSGARLFVFADSSKVYGNGPVPFRAEQAENPICSYAVAKAAAWRICSMLAHRQIAMVGLRPTFIYGPRQNFNLLSYLEQAVRKNETIRIQGGRQTRDLLFVQDAVECFANVMNAPDTWGRSLPIGGGHEIRVSDLCREALRALGSDADLVEDAETVRPTEIWRSFCDNEEICRYSGWSPRVGLREGLSRTFLSALPQTERLQTFEAVAV